MSTDGAAARSGKRLALFLDGTWNTVSSNTNVWRMKSMCARSGVDGVAQAVYYDKGSGTTMGEIVRGGVFGYGIDDAVVDAYEWLMESFDDGDEPAHAHTHGEVLRLDVGRADMRLLGHA